MEPWRDRVFRIQNRTLALFASLAGRSRFGFWVFNFGFWIPLAHVLGPDDPVKVVGAVGADQPLGRLQANFDVAGKDLPPVQVPDAYLFGFRVHDISVL
jgi:hypothetical protein